MRRLAVILSVLAITMGLIAAQERADMNLKRLDRIYLMIHALNWLEIVPGDPRRQDPHWEQFPGRCDLCYAYEQPLKEKYYALLGKPDEQAAVFIMPSGMQGDPPLIQLAQQTFGDRCLVCPLGYDVTANAAALGEEFAQGLAEDEKRARAIRGELPEGDVLAWGRSKSWAVWFTRELRRAGYTFDPQTVEVQALGEDWCGCAATFPIHMSRAFGLKTPIWRRFDLMNPDCSRLLLQATLVEQNLPMPSHIRLLIVRTAEGRLAAQYWEGQCGLWDWPHKVTVKFQRPAARRVGTGGEYFQDQPQQTVEVSVGAGGHTPHAAHLLMAEPDVSLEEFKTALLAGEVSEVKQ